jgi:hypothetical protein
MIVIASEAKEIQGHVGRPTAFWIAASLRYPRDDQGPRLSDFIRASGHQRRANRPDI